MGNNREFDMYQTYFEVVLFIIGEEGTYDHRRSTTECLWLPIVTHSNQSVSG